MGFTIPGRYTMTLLTETTNDRVTLERRGRVLLMGLNRTDKHNVFDTAMLNGLANAFTLLEDDDELWCGVVHAHGTLFTAGLDLNDVAPKVAQGSFDQPEGSVDPWGVHGRVRTKPVVGAVRGKCLTLGIELLLALDIRVAAQDATFAQIEIHRGIFPFGGATLRFPQIAGWGNAMRYLLTGDEFGAAEAYRLGLVQEVVETGHELERAVELAERIVSRAPLGVRATLASARQAVEGGQHFGEAAGKLFPEVVRLFGTQDAQEGVRSFFERREAEFKGR